MIMSVTPRRPNMPSTAMSAIPLERRVTRGDAGLLQGAVPAHGLRRVIRLTIPQFLAALAVVN